MRKLRRFGQSRAVAPIDAIADPEELLTDPDALRKTIARRFANPRYKPPTLPAVATQLLALEARGDVGFDEIVRLLEQDAVLSGKILHLVRSPLYAGRMPIRTLHAAVVRMGLTTVRNTVMEVAMASRIMTARAPLADAMQQVALHSRATAHLARAIARRTPFDAEVAFLAGLLHDLGSAAAFLVLADMLPPTMRIKSFPVVWSAVEALHERTSVKLAGIWGLPHAVTESLTAHHTPSSADGEVGLGRAIVCVAEHVATECGAAASLVGDVTGHPRFDLSSAAELEVAHDRIKFGDVERTWAMEEGARVLEVLRLETAARAA